MNADQWLQCKEHTIRQSTRHTQSKKSAKFKANGPEIPGLHLHNGTENPPGSIFSNFLLSFIIFNYLFVYLFSDLIKYPFFTKIQKNIIKIRKKPKINKYLYYNYFHK